MSMMDCVIKCVEGHLEAYDKQGRFLQSADNRRELENDIQNYIDEQIKFCY